MKVWELELIDQSPHHKLLRAKHLPVCTRLPEDETNFKYIEIGKECEQRIIIASRSHAYLLAKVQCYSKLRNKVRRRGSALRCGYVLARMRVRKGQHTPNTINTVY